MLAILLPFHKSKLKFIFHKKIYGSRCLHLQYYLVTMVSPQKRSMNAEKAKEEHAETKEAHGNVLEEQREVQIKNKIMAALLEHAITHQHKHQGQLTREPIDTLMSILGKDFIPNSPDDAIQLSNVGIAIQSFLLDLKESAWEGCAYEGGSLICNTAMFSGQHSVMVMLHSSYPWLKSKIDPVVIVAPPLNFKFQAYLTNLNWICIQSPYKGI